MSNTKMSMNPSDEIAVEKAMRLCERGSANEVVAISVGGALCQETLRAALAIGADRAVLLETEDELQPVAVAKLLKALCAFGKIDRIFFGKQAIDDASNQTGQIPAARGGMLPTTIASTMEISEANAYATAKSTTVARRFSDFRHRGSRACGRPFPSRCAGSSGLMASFARGRN